MKIKNIRTLAITFIKINNKLMLAITFIKIYLHK